MRDPGAVAAGEGAARARRRAGSGTTAKHNGGNILKDGIRPDRLLLKSCHRVVTLLWRSARWAADGGWWLMDGGW